VKNHDVNSLGGNLLVTNFHAENFLGEFLQFGVITTNFQIRAASFFAEIFLGV